MENDLIANGPDGGGAPAGFAPDGSDMSHRCRAHKRTHRDAVRAAVGSTAGERGQQCHTPSDSHHLAQGLDAGGAKVLLLAHAGAMTDRQSLVTQAVAVL